MNKFISSIRGLRWIVAAISSFLGVLITLFSITVNVQAQEYNPWFTLFPEQGIVEGWDWPVDAEIHMVIDDPSTNTSPDFESYGTMVPTPWDPESGATWLWIDFADAYTTKAGDIITLQVADTGIMERTHTVQNLSISLIDPNENTVLGKADAMQAVILWSWEDPQGRQIETTADDGGNWIVDFDNIGFDLEPGYHVRAEVWGENGNDTAVDRLVTNPRFTVFPDWEWFDGLDWPDGATVTITVENKEDVCNTEGISWDYFFNGGFPDGCDIVVGDVVTFTDGTTTRMHSVQNLAITKVVPEDDTIKGVADPGAEVFSWPHTTGQTLLAIAKINGEAIGNWNADFSGIFNLVPGECGRSEIRDEFANSTAVDWCVPNAHFTVWPEWNYLEGYEWINGHEVSITVTGKDACSTKVKPDFPEWDPWNTFFSVDFPEDCTLEPGDLITLSSETFNLTHQIQELSITGVNIDDGTVAGTAIFDPEQYLLHTWIHDVDESNMQLLAEGGTWMAEFGSLGFDLQPGMSGRVELIDQASNATAVEWNILSPRLITFPAVDQIFAYNWPDDSEVSLTINDVYIATAKVQGAPWDPNDIMALFDFSGLYDLIAEDEVTLSGSGMELTYTVQNLSVTEVNEQTNTVSGTADYSALVNAGVFDWWDVTEMQLTAKDGTWQADFGSLGFDLSAGMCGRAAIWDEAGNRTAVDWCVPNTHFTVFPERNYLEGHE